MDTKPKQSLELSTDGVSSSQCSEISKSDRVIHDAELGEENVELVDSEWADFERALRYDAMKNFTNRVNLSSIFFFFL